MLHAGQNDKNGFPESFRIGRRLFSHEWQVCHFLPSAISLAAWIYFPAQLPISRFLHDRAGRHPAFAIMRRRLEKRHRHWVPSFISQRMNVSFPAKLKVYTPSIFPFCFDHAIHSTVSWGSKVQQLLNDATYFSREKNCALDRGKNDGEEALTPSLKGQDWHQSDGVNSSLRSAQQPLVVPRSILVKWQQLREDTHSKWQTSKVDLPKKLWPRLSPSPFHRSIITGLLMARDWKLEFPDSRFLGVPKFEISIRETGKWVSL